MPEMPTAAHPAAVRAPRRVFPLYAKILLLFFFNVLLVAGGAFWFVCSSFELDRNWMLDRNARERLQLLAEAIVEETEGIPRSEWTAVLERQGKAHHAELALLNPEGQRVAGAELPLPPEVEKVVAQPPTPGPGRRPEPPRGQDRAERAGGFPDFRKEAVHAGGAFWVIVRMPPHGGRLMPPDRNPMLVGRISGLGESGLLFNPVPWVLAGAGVLLVTALLWIPLVRGLTKSLAQMTRAADAVAQGQFDARVDDRRRDELGQLGASINAMSERLGGFVTGQKRFLGDIAHELCSPLARMEMALSILENKLPEELGGRLADVREEAGEMNALVSELLSFSKAGFKEAEPLREEVPLAEAARSAISREAAEAEVLMDIPDALTVRAVPALLGRALGNLLRNAVRYASHAGPIEVSAARHNGTVELTVGDHGPGVNPEDLPRIFDPFFRSDKSRTRETGGVGLGLAIVKSCVDGCGGSVSATNRATGGLLVTISLPAAG